MLSGHGLIPFDYDRDGDMDLLIVPEIGDTPHLFENRTPRQGRHWLIVDLIGTRSNRDGIGARVEVIAGGVTMTRPIMGSYSFKSGPPKEAHFGLGTSPQVDQLKVTFPSGAVKIVKHFPADHYVLVKEE